jgi:Pterin binding enzyme
MSSPLPGSAPPGPLLPAGNPRIVGIVNITEDSFSDGGRYLDPAAAVAHARNLRAEGADIIELGPAASHPDSAPISVAKERRRLAPVLEQLSADGVPVSVDSFLPETLRYAISVGVACLNDIQQHLQRQPLGGAGHQAVDLGGGQVDAAVAQQGHQVGGGEDPVLGHHLAQPPGVAGLALHACLPAWAWRAAATVSSSCRRRVRVRKSEDTHNGTVRYQNYPNAIRRRARIGR